MLLNLTISNQFPFLIFMQSLKVVEILIFHPKIVDFMVILLLFICFNQSEDFQPESKTRRQTSHDFLFLSENFLKDA